MKLEDLAHLVWTEDRAASNRAEELLKKAGLKPHEVHELAAVLTWDDANKDYFRRIALAVAQAVLSEAARVIEDAGFDCCYFPDPGYAKSRSRCADLLHEMSTTLSKHE